MKILSRSVLWLITLFSMVSVHASTELIQQIENQPVPTHPQKVLTVEQVRTGILNALKIKQWDVINDKPAEQKMIVRKSWKAGKHTMLCAISYSAKQLNIVYYDSDNLKYDAAGLTIHSAYNKNVQDLARLINLELRLEVDK